MSFNSVQFVLICFILLLTFACSLVIQFEEAGQFEQSFVWIRVITFSYIRLNLVFALDHFSLLVELNGLQLAGRL